MRRLIVIIFMIVLISSFSGCLLKENDDDKSKLILIIENSSNATLEFNLSLGFNNDVLNIYKLSLQTNETKNYKLSKLENLMVSINIDGYDEFLQEYDNPEPGTKHIIIYNDRIEEV